MDVVSKISWRRGGVKTFSTNNFIKIALHQPSKTYSPPMPDLEAVVPNNADDSDDGLDVDDDVADPDYTPETGIVFEIETYEGDGVGCEGSSQHQDEPKKGQFIKNAESGSEILM